jgi:hypothetical protein
MTALTSSNCAGFLKSIITTGSAMRAYINAMPTGTDVGTYFAYPPDPPEMCTAVITQYGVRLDIATNLDHDLSAGVLGVGIGTLPATNTTYFPISSGFDNLWFLSQTAGTNTGVDYADNPCGPDFGATGHIRWGAPFVGGVVAQISGMATAFGITFEAAAAKLDSYFRISGDTTPGYCLAITRQIEADDQINNCYNPGVSYYALNYEIALLYLNVAVPTGTFSAFPSSINNGDSSTLTWTSTNATTASIDNGVGSVSPVAGGSVSVSPSVTTTYTLTLTGVGGTITKTATVTVGHPLPDAIFTASPSPISPGVTSTLSWTISNGVTASINQGIGSVSASSGTHDVNPLVTTTYTLTIINLNGTTNKTATVTVVPDPTGTFVCDPTSIFDGQTVDLVWTSSNAVTASIDHSIGSVSPVAGGRVTVSPSGTTTYTLTLTNSLGVTATLMATVTVTVRPAYRQFFSEIDQTELRDWVRGTTDNSGMRFSSFLETNQSLHDADLKSQVPYLYTFINGGVDVDDPIGAFVSIVWDWRSHNDTLRVTAPTQIYDFHAGHLLSVKKTRVRGRGRSLNLRYTSDADKDFKLKGWAIFYNVNGGQ